MKIKEQIKIFLFLINISQLNNKNLVLGNDFVQSSSCVVCRFVSVFFPHYCYFVRWIFGPYTTTRLLKFDC